MGGQTKVSDEELRLLDSGLEAYISLVADWARSSRSSDDADPKGAQSLGERIDGYDRSMQYSCYMMQIGRKLVTGVKGDRLYDTFAAHLHDSVADLFYGSQLAMGTDQGLTLAMQVMIQQMDAFAQDPVGESEALFYMANVVARVDQKFDGTLSRFEMDLGVQYGAACVSRGEIILPKKYVMDLRVRRDCVLLASHHG